MFDVEKAFGETCVLKGFTLTVDEGQTLSIIGGSGSGKSTALKHMVGLLRPDDGEVYVDEQNVSRLDQESLYALRRNVGYVFQFAALFDSMTVEENVSFPLREPTRLSPREISEKDREKLHLVGLDGIEDRMPSQLSGGMQKRVGLARAIIREPEILLYDEPTTGLDPILADSIDRLIVRMEETLSITSLIISHDIQRAMEFAHSVAMLYEGKILAHGSPQEISSSDNPVIRQFLAGSSEGPIQVL